jgi:hypothetical protein
MQTNHSMKLETKRQVLLKKMNRNLEAKELNA